MFIVLSGFATTDLSVRFRDACQGGGAYGKTALPRPYRIPVKFLPGIHQEINFCPIRKPAPLAAAERPSAASQ
ncbi:hypothetical protein [Escherichia coli]|uniref:hypothetical protein n=1 Tax=Escherichia coli TaxID=562 RepID=UPI00225555E7